MKLKHLETLPAQDKAIKQSKSNSVLKTFIVLKLAILHNDYF